MGNTEWEQERLYVMEMLRDNKKGLTKIEDSVHDFKLETAKAITELQTKLGIYVLIGSAIVSTVVTIAIKFIPGS